MNDKVSHNDLVLSHSAASSSAPSSLRMTMLKKQLEKFLIPTGAWQPIPPPTVTDLDEDIEGKFDYEFAGGEMALCPVEASRFLALRTWLKRQEEEEEEEEEERCRGGKDEKVIMILPQKGLRPGFFFS